MNTIFVFSLLTAVATGLGSLPFAFCKTFSPKMLGIGGSVAAALMLVASFGMLYQGMPMSILATVGGVLVGIVLISLASHWLDQHHDHVYFGDLQGLNAKKVLLMVGVMFVHSFAEGIAIGVSFGPSLEFGIFVALIMMIQNIPEGLAISLTMVPRGVSRRKAGLWSIFSSLPQPLMAIPAFWIVSTLPLALPAGLGFAAGAMIWMSFSELLPDAIKDTPKYLMATIMTIAIALMIMIEQLLGG